MAKRMLDQDERQTLQHALDVAQRAFRGHARAMDECAKTGGNAMLSVESARVMAEDHLRTAERTAQLGAVIAEAEDVWIEE